MKKILGLTVAALLVMAMVSGGTWAYFSDTESSTNNSLTAGTLDLNIDGGNVAVTTFTTSAVAPGDNGSGSSTLSNAGGSSITGELDITFSAITNTPGAGGGEYEGGSGELGANAEIAVYLDVDQSADWSAGDIGLKSDGTTYNHPTALDYATIDSYDSDSWDAVETMAPSAADDFIVLWRVPTTAGNDIQGDGASFDVTFVLEQAAAD
jgi:spore coat-associated protein N